MKITWLGQAGLLFETAGKKIIVDPYLSDSVEKVNPKNYRRVPVDESFLKIKPDVIVLTHDHLDHTDPETLEHYLGEGSSLTLIAPYNAWQTARKFGGSNNYVCLNRHSRFTVDGIEFYAVKAEHSDLMAVGIVINAEGKNYYVTGDTLYNDDIFADLPQDIEAIFLPVNGIGNNMNAYDAQKFAEKTGAKTAVPMHFGLFDELKGDIFKAENRVIPEIYKEIKL